MIALRRVAYHPLVSGSAALVGARLVSILASLTAVSIVVRTLDAENFGFWSALVSLTTLTAGLDLGIGSAVRNRIAAYRAVGDQRGAEEALGAALLVVGMLSAALIVVTLVSAGVGHAAGWIEWSEEQAVAFVVTVMCLGAFQLGNLGQLALYASERPSAVAAIEVARWVMTIPVLLLVAAASAGLVPATAGYFLALTLSALSAFAVLARQDGWPRAGTPRSAWALTRRDLWTGAGFALLQLVATLVYQTDVLIAAQRTSLVVAGDFALVQRLYLVPLTLLFAAVTPLWARTSAEVARGNGAWARHWAQRLSVLAAGAAALAGLAIVVAGPHAVTIWAGRAVSNPSLYLGLAAWLVLAAWVMVLSVVLNGMGRVWGQVRWLSVALVIKVAVAWLLVERFGVAALAWGAAASLVPLAWANWRDVRRSLGPDARPVARQGMS
ncbi:MAG: lipopolysaccharide biosynthesis protein [Dehalococcoidia bacterium]|nr:MAG: lipopolysaccharide biosynthesis protein [Dehalococcoidia bacterium]